MVCGYQGWLRLMDCVLWLTVGVVVYAHSSQVRHLVMLWIGVTVGIRVRVTIAHQVGFGQGSCNGLVCKFGRLTNRPITNDSVKDGADSLANSLHCDVPDHGVHNAAPTVGWACGDAGSRDRVVHVHGMGFWCAGWRGLERVHGFRGLVSHGDRIELRVKEMICCLSAAA